MSGQRLRVAVIGGGENCEHDVSLASAASVVAALDTNRYRSVGLTITLDGHWTDEHGRPLAQGRAAGLAAAVRILAGCDVVVPMVHGPLGEDGALAALCALAGVPFVGSPLGAGAIGMDKTATKAVAESIGVRTAAGFVLTASDRAATPPIPVRFPVVVKPVAAGSSHGVTVARDEAQLAAAVSAAFAFGSAVLVEQFVTGREIDVAVLRLADGTLRVSPPLEVLLGAGAVFDTAGKYDGTADFGLPAAISPAERGALESAALRMFTALGCAGVARIDFFLTPDGPVLNEVNTTPGFTAASQVPRMFGAAGLPYPVLIEALIDEALARSHRDSPARGRAGLGT